MSDETPETPAATPASSADATPATPEVVTTTTASKTTEPVIGPLDWVFFVGLAVISASLDLSSKAWALNALSRTQTHPPPLCSPPPGMTHYLPQRMATREIVLIRDLLDLQYAENCGGAWGLLHGASETFRRPFFLAVTVGAIAFIVYLYRNLEKGQTPTKWALPLVLGGAIGNLVDRVRLGYVVDFIHMHWRTHHWPTYNVADIAISVGIGLMLLEYIIGPKPAKKPASNNVSAPVQPTA